METKAGTFRLRWRDFWRFVIAFFVIFIGLNAARFGLIFAVDPYERFLVDPNNVTVNRERWAKPWFIKTFPHNAILLGTSKLAHVDPVDVDTADLKFFNASFAGALPEEMYSFLDIFVPEARLVVISLDIIPMNENTWSLRPTNWGEPSFKNAAIAYCEYLSDRAMFTLAVEQLIAPRIEKTMLKRNGARIITADLSRSAAMTAPDFVKPLQQLRGAAFGEFKYSEARIAYIEKIKALLEQRHISYIVLISPESRAMLQMIHDAGNQWVLERFRADIKRIFPHAIDYSDSWVSADENFLKFDPVHYLPNVGAKMVREAVTVGGP